MQAETLRQFAKYNTFVALQGTDHDFKRALAVGEVFLAKVVGKAVEDGHGVALVLQRT